MSDLKILRRYNCKTIPGDRMELYHVQPKNPQQPGYFGILIDNGDGNRVAAVHLTPNDARNLAEAVLTKLYIPDKEST